MHTLTYCLLLSLILCTLAARTGVRSGKEEVIPEFFDDDQNVYCLIVGFSIILLSVIIAIVIFRVRSRAAAFEGSLFQHLEDED
jgi:uncharacterized membrane protein